MLRSKLLLAGAVLLASCARPAERAAAADTSAADTSATGPGPRSPTGAGTPGAPGVTVPVVTVPVVTVPIVTARGIGALRAGASFAAASAALGGALVVPAGTDTAGCGYVEWRGGPRGVRVMVEGGRIARIDVDTADTAGVATAGVATAAGVRVGDSEARVRSLYGGRVAVSPHKYEEGHYLTAADPADTGFALVFETARGRVTRYRAGRRPQVEYVEGCG